MVSAGGGAGSKAAAPVGRDILLAAQKLEAARIANAATGAILPFAPAG